MERRESVMIGRHVHRSTKRLLTGGLAACAAALVVAGCGGVERSESGAITSEGAVGVEQLKVGDCVNLPSGESASISNVAGVPCDQPHDGEVYLVDSLPDGDFPGKDETATKVEKACGPAFEEFVGGSYQATELDVLYLYPADEESWAADRSYDCIAYHPGEQVTGSLKGQASAHPSTVASYAVGDCFGQPDGPDTAVVPCADPHSYEVFATGALPEGSFPGTDAVTQTVDETCQAAFANYVGTEYEASALDIVQVGPDEKTWAAGDRAYVCLIQKPDGSPLTGSVKSSGM